MKKVGILMGSDSDLPVVEKAILKLKEFDVPCEVHVYSAHRTPKEAADFVASATLLTAWITSLTLSSTRA